MPVNFQSGQTLPPVGSDAYKQAQVQTGTGTYNPTSGQLTVSPTVLTNTNIYDKTIPDLNARANAVRSTYIPPVGTSNANPNTTQPTSFEDTYNQIFGKLDSQPDTTTDNMMELIRKTKANSDAQTSALLSGIQSQYETKKNLLTEQQKASTKGISNALLLSGAEKYAPISSSGVVSVKERFDLQTLDDLQNEENMAKLRVMQAQSDKDYQTLNKQLEILDSTRKQKMSLAEKIATSMKESTQKAIEQNNQARIDSAINDTIASGITDPVGIMNDLKKRGYSDVTFDNVADVTDRIKKWEFDYPGIVGELLGAKASGTVPENTTIEQFAFMKDPTKALDMMKTSLQINQLKKELGVSGAQADQYLTAARIYASTGLMPGDAKLSDYNKIADIARDLPKDSGTLVSKDTGIKPSNQSISQEKQDGLAGLYNAFKKTDDLLELDKNRIGGVIAGTIGKVTGSKAQLDYLTARDMILKELQYALSGKAITQQEMDYFESLLPGRFSESFGLGTDSTDKINAFKTNIQKTLRNKLDSNSASIYGFSKVKIGNEEYTVGDIIQNETGQQGRVNADGSITLIN